jgi:hypothetical protein
MNSFNVNDVKDCNNCGTCESCTEKTNYNYSYIHSLIQDLRKELQGSKAREMCQNDKNGFMNYISSRHDYLSKNFPTIFMGLLKGSINDSNISQLNFMLKAAHNRKVGNITNYESDKEVGNYLANKYIYSDEKLMEIIGKKP